MESNREEAKRCMQLAVEAYRNHSSENDNLSLEKAKRLTRKSIRLYPSEEAEGNYYIKLLSTQSLFYLRLFSRYQHIKFLFSFFTEFLATLESQSCYNETRSREDQNHYHKHMNGNAHKGMQTNIIGPQRPKSILYIY